MIWMIANWLRDSNDCELRSWISHNSRSPPMQRHPHIYGSNHVQVRVPVFKELGSLIFWLMAIRERLDRFCYPVSKFWVSFCLISWPTVVYLVWFLHCMHTLFNKHSGVMDRPRVIFTPPYQTQKRHLTPAAMMKWTSLSVLKTQPFSMASALSSGCLLGSPSVVVIQDSNLHWTLDCSMPPN